MALVSMTGYGRGEATMTGIQVEVELSSVNRKQFDMRVSIPRSLVVLESRVREQVRKRVARGFVSGSVKVGFCGEARRGAVRVNTDLAQAYLAALRRTGKQLGLEDDITLRTLAQFPEVVHHRDVSDDSEKAWRVLSRALSAALEQLVSMRAAEGSALEKDLKLRLERLTRRLARIRKLAPGTAHRYRRQLHRRLADVGVPLDLDDTRVLREIALYVDRSDVSEEITRLDSHFTQAAKLITSKKPVGRALDFMCQEMFREINTIGSKANDSSVSRHVIAFKTELETVREQVQNVQ